MNRLFFSRFMVEAPGIERVSVTNESSQKQADPCVPPIGPIDESEPLRSGSRSDSHTLNTTGTIQPTDGDLERGILDVVKMGLADVARTLSDQLSERQPARAGNVVPLRGRVRP